MSVNSRLACIQARSFALSYAYDAAGNVKSILDKPSIAFSDTFSGLSQWTAVDGVTGRIVWRCKAGINGGVPT
jgi:hypothetical protein